MTWRSFSQDPTGRLKVSRFLAGKRFSSPAYLKGQQRLYPVGATVAVSGLVKDGPYGITFQDPLIEVLDSPSSPVKSHPANTRTRMRDPLVA